MKIKGRKDGKHKPEQINFFEETPTEVALLLLRFMSVKSLANLSCTSKHIHRFSISLAFSLTLRSRSLLPYYSSHSLYSRSLSLYHSPSLSSVLSPHSSSLDAHFFIHKVLLRIHRCGVESLFEIFQITKLPKKRMTWIGRSCITCYQPGV